MSHNGHPNTVPLENIPIDPTMTQTQVHVQPFQQHAIFSAYDPHASSSMSSYPYSPAAPPQQSSTSAEQYRNSPTSSHSSMHLPPIRSIEARQTQPPQQPSSAMQNPYAIQVGTPNPVPGYHTQMSQVAPFYAPPPMGTPYVPLGMGGQSAMNMPSSPQVMRWPIPPADERKMLSGGRHKKEVKRRTKTGCLTCRKRRIKCDEGQPSCRNCQKSKRECLGYDPIFKPQHGPSSTQPVASLSQQGSASPSPAHSYTAASLGQPPSTGASRSNTTGSPRSAHSSSDPISQYAPESSVGHSRYSGPQVSGSEPSTSSITSYPSGAMTRSPIPLVRELRLGDLQSINGHPPPLLPSTSQELSAQDHDRIEGHFARNFASAIDQLFEVQFWISEGSAKLRSNAGTAALYKQYLDHAAENEDLRHPPILSEESLLLWELFRLCDVVERPGPLVAPLGLVSHRPKDRLRVVEALLTGETLPMNTLSPQSLAGTDELRIREHEFWFCLAQVVSIDEKDGMSAKQIDDMLDRCRAVLNNLEERDVLYSIAVIRHLGRRWGGMLQTSPSASEAKKHFEIARNFIETETIRGTTSVIQRVCAMARRAWTT